jgi:hypothetical protein
VDIILKKAFSDMVHEYGKILNFYYPAHKSTGFMEANQVHLFVKSLTNSEDDTFAWLEAPLKQEGKSYPHIDGVVFLPKKEAVVFIEAKRINDPSKKIPEIYSDVKRLLEAKNRSHILKSMHCDVFFKKQYIVYLADVWLETPRKKSIPFWWCSNSTLAGMNGRESVRYKNEPSFIETFHSQNIWWKKDNQLVHRFVPENKMEICLKNYCLLFGFHELV